MNDTELGSEVKLLVSAMSSLVIPVSKFVKYVPLLMTMSVLGAATTAWLLYRNYMRDLEVAAWQKQVAKATLDVKANVHTIGDHVDDLARAVHEYNSYMSQHRDKLFRLKEAMKK